MILLPEHGAARAPQQQVRLATILLFQKKFHAPLRHINSPDLPLSIALAAAAH
jgi:hypothetical protein